MSSFSISPLFFQCAVHLCRGLRRPSSWRVQLWAHPGVLSCQTCSPGGHCSSRAVCDCSGCAQAFRDSESYATCAHTHTHTRTHTLYTLHTPSVQPPYILYNLPSAHGLGRRDCLLCACMVQLLSVSEDSTLAVWQLPLEQDSQLQVSMYIHTYIHTSAEVGMEP